MPDHHNKKKFLNLPRYTGGNKAFREFITGNLVYPEEALNASVEGTVIVEYDILDSGVVQHPRILKGIGHGCDEEAMRVVMLLRYEKVKNRGVRVKITNKTNINFKLPPGIRINYTVAGKAEPENTANPGPEKPGPVSYEYTISF
jgi:TonB family protein